MNGLSLKTKYLKQSPSLEFFGICSGWEHSHGFNAQRPVNLGGHL